MIITQETTTVIVSSYLMTAGKYNKRDGMPLRCKCNHIQPNRCYNTTIGHDSMSANYNL